MTMAHWHDLRGKRPRFRGNSFTGPCRHGRRSFVQSVVGQRSVPGYVITRECDEIVITGPHGINLKTSFAVARRGSEKTAAAMGLILGDKPHTARFCSIYLAAHDTAVRLIDELNRKRCEQVYLSITYVCIANPNCI